MATWAAVAKLALALPDAVETNGKQGLRAWRVKDKTFAWERPLRGSDLRALGADAPTGPILGVYVPDLVTKDAMISARGDVFFTTPHFNGYPAVLVRLGVITSADLKEVLREGWLCRAPKPGASKRSAPKRRAAKPPAARPPAAKPPAARPPAAKPPAAKPPAAKPPAAKPPAAKPPAAKPPAPKRRAAKEAAARGKRPA